MLLSSVSKEETIAQEKSQMTATEQWWIPTDPVSERKPVAVLVEMAKCVLAGERGNTHQLEAEELPPLPDAEPFESEVSVLHVLHQAGGMAHFDNR